MLSIIAIGVTNLNAQTQNCTGIAAWSTTTIYSSTINVVYNGVLYQNNFWTQGAQPDLNSQAVGATNGKPWAVLGTCEVGTATTDVGLWSSVYNSPNIIPSNGAGVSIGTTIKDEPTLSTPYYRFNVKGASNFIGNTNVLSLWYSPVTGSNPNPRHYLAFDNFADRTVINSAKWTSGSASTTPPTGENLVLQNLSAGNLGVGIDYPIEKLHLGGNLLVTGDINVGNQNATTFPSYGTKLSFSRNAVSDNTDILWISRYNVIGNQTELRVNIGDDPTLTINPDAFVVGSSDYTKSGAWTPALTVNTNGDTKIAGKLIVGTNSSTATKTYSANLAVYGNSFFEAVKVKPAAQWPDYVFAKEYKLMSLDSLQNYISKESHLPNVPSAAEMSKQDLDLAEMNALLLRKVEELTLYILEQDKKIKAIEAKVK